MKPALLLAATAVLLLCACGDEKEAAGKPPSQPRLVGLWKLDEEASLAASRANSAGDADETERNRRIESFERDLASLDAMHAEFSQDGRFSVRAKAGDSESELVSGPYKIVSESGDEIVVEVEGETETMTFDGADRMRGNSAGGVLIQVWDRVR